MAKPQVGDIWVYQDKHYWLLLEEKQSPYEYHFIAANLTDGGRISRINPKLATRNWRQEG